MLKEFKEFAFKGNLVDMAVGIIIGGAFGTVVKSLVDNVFMPPLGLALGRVDFKAMKLVLQPAAGEAPEVALRYGQFVTDFISFLLLATAVFVLVKKVMEGFKKKEAAPPPAPPAPTRDQVLLEEIRDLLKASR